MRTINDVEKLAKKLLDTRFTIKTIDGNIYTYSANELNYSFVFNNRTTKRLGCCYYQKLIIELSTKYVKNNVGINNDAIEDTIRHEIAHALAYKIYGTRAMGHNGLWKDVAVQVGAMPKRGKTNIVSSREYKYIGTCPKCSNKFKALRKPRKSKACGDCCKKYNNNKYSSEFQIEYVKKD